MISGMECENCPCKLIVSENSCFNTAERIQIITMNKCSRNLNNNNLNWPYSYKYLIRLLSKTIIQFNSVILQVATCV